MCGNILGGTPRLKPSTSSGSATRTGRGCSGSRDEELRRRRATRGHVNIATMRRINHLAR